ncbi:hypothetical protein B0O41_4076 [Propionibacteriaceae bacterium ES.041]|uniref:cytochrome P450 n=1 Tax=Enemella evansiae TaxID=2016499 RepID=UPI000B96B1DD|nr:cytochrome P450 [Enemella evansiae]OYO03022.1 cytochrome P450 [Enemella evansiae]PFG69223.1 hypothetical protein B0O41_4076 [Propionibacteriaceae bacterium ES.041]
MQDAAAPTTAPVIDWFDPHEMFADPYPGYARLREVGPVVQVPTIGRHLMTSQAAVLAAEHDPETFSSHSSPNLMVEALGGRPMLRLDDPAHAEERGAVNPTLRPKAIKTVWSAKFEESVDRWLDRLAEVSDPDLNRDFAAPVASQNLIDLVGFDVVDGVTVDDMARWSTDYIAGIGNILDDQDIWARCTRSREEVDAVLDELIPRLAKEPNGSVTSHLMQAGLSEDQVRVNTRLTISGGMNEPQHMITAMVWALEQHPEQRAMVLDDPSLFGGAFEETVRWQSPIGMVPRQTTRDVEVLGVQIPEGAQVGVLLASANRDPEAFPDPDRFDITRHARGHVGFGNGAHMCAGRWAAKTAVGEIALPRLYQRFPDLALAADRPASWAGWVFRGITELPVRLRA